MRVLGLDPGLSCAGYGVVDAARGSVRLVEAGAVRTRGDAVPDRLSDLHRRLAALLDAHRPDAVAVERVLFSSNARTAMSVGQAAGVALLVAAQAGCEVAEYSPNEMKLAVTGYGAADKLQVQRMVARLLGLPALPRPADAADALGLAITHVHAHRMRRIVRGA